MAEIGRPGATFYYSETGPRHAPVVVFGHGLFFTGSLFHYQLDDLRHELRCVTVDWRGHGLTSTRGAFTIDDLSDDLEALVRHFEQPVHYVGHGLGGAVVLPLAARRPHLFRSLSLLGASANAEDPDDAWSYHRLARSYRRGGSRLVAPRLKRSLFSEASRRSGRVRRDIANWSEELGYPSRTEVRNAVRATANRRGAQCEASTIKVPTQLVVGEQDDINPPHRTRRLEELIPNAHVHLVKGAGHALPLEAPRDVSRLLWEFIVGVERHAVRLPGV